LEIVMNNFRVMALAALVALAQAAVAAEAAACPTDGYAPAQYKIYVDPPSGDAYIRTPCGWRFIRTIEAPRIAEAIRMARVHPADLPRENTATDRKGR
jgi:hypothetical protein